MNWKMTAKTILMQLHHKIRTFEAMNLGADGDYDLQLRMRASTDSEGIAACLGLRAEPDVGLEKIIRQLEDRMSDRTLVRMDS